MKKSREILQTLDFFFPDIHLSSVEYTLDHVYKLSDAIPRGQVIPSGLPIIFQCAESFIATLSSGPLLSFNNHTDTNVSASTYWSNKLLNKSNKTLYDKSKCFPLS